MLDFNNFSLTNYGFQLVFNYHPGIAYPATNQVKISEKLVLKTIVQDQASFPAPSPKVSY